MTAAQTQTAPLASPQGGAPTLRLEGVSKTFRATRALEDVTIEVMPGEIHGLLGTNGSGKSTLIKILAGYHAPDPGGRMTFNGEDVALPQIPAPNDTLFVRRAGAGRPQ